MRLLRGLPTIRLEQLGWLLGTAWKADGSFTGIAFNSQASRHYGMLTRTAPGPALKAVCAGNGMVIDTASIPPIKEDEPRRLSASVRNGMEPEKVLGSRPTSSASINVSKYGICNPVGTGHGLLNQWCL